MNLNSLLSLGPDNFCKKYTEEEGFEILWNIHESIPKLPIQKIGEWADFLEKVIECSRLYQYMYYLIKIIYYSVVNYGKAKEFYDTHYNEIFGHKWKTRTPIQFHVVFSIIDLKAKNGDIENIDKEMEFFEELEREFYGHPGIESIALKVRLALLRNLPYNIEELEKQGHHLIETYRYPPANRIKYYFFMAEFYANRKDRKAIYYYKKAIETAYKNGMMEGVGACLSNLARYFVFTGKNEQALILIDRSLEFFKGYRGGQWKANYAVILQIKSVVLRRMDRLREAMKVLKEMDLYASDKLLPYYYHTLGNIYIDLGDYRKAVEFCEKALPYMNYFRGNELFNLYFSLAYASILSGDRQRAQEYLDRMSEFSGRDMELTIEMLFLRARYAETLGDIQGAMKIYRDILEREKECKNAMVREFIFEASVRYLRHQLRKEGMDRRIFEEVSSMAREEGISKKLKYDFLNIKIEKDIMEGRYDEALKKLEPEWDGSWPSDGFTYLKYIYTDKDIYIFTGEGPELIKVRFNEPDGYLYKIARGRKRFQKSVLKRLYSLLIEPVADRLGEKVVVLPYGKLFSVPFHLLYDGDRHIFERYRIAYMHHLRKPADRRKNFKSIVSIGISRFEDRVLRFIEPELRLVTSKFERGEYYLDDEIRRRDIFRKMKNYDIIHFATHQIPSEECELNEILYILKKGRAVLPLESKDFKNVRFLKKPLITISSCLSGWNGYHARGRVLELVKTLIDAGAMGVVLNLGESYDKYTMKFMDWFYQELSATGDILLSIQNAYKAMKYDYGIDDPSIWGGFVLYMG